MRGPRARPRLETAAQIPERSSPGPPVGVQVANHGQGARLRGGRPHAHDHPTGNEDVGVGGHGGDDRSGDEHGHTGQHDLLAAEEVTDGAEN